jgi:DNA-directed DNA polymerase III PolC
MTNTKNKSSFLEKFEGISMPLHGVRLPSFEIDKKYKRKLGLSEDIDNENFLKSLCEIGMREIKKEGNAKYQERLDHELKTIKELGFVDYLLLVWDVINFCKENDIPTGLGRGSAAGSLILYLIGVTRMDPVKYGLYFERFVSKIRAKKKVVNGVTYLDGSLMCDVDLDICYYNRSRVLEYIDKKFKGRTSKILTLNTLSTKLLIKECGKIVADKSESDMNSVSSMIPKIFGRVKDLESSYEEVEDFRDWCDENKECYNIALKLRNLVKNKGVHPSAVCISYSPMDESCPVELDSKKESGVSSYDMNWVSLFNVKLDVLGLRAVSVVDDVCKNVGISTSDIDLDDAIIYQNLYDLKNPHGLFQIEADTNFRVCQKVKPKDLEELSAVLALARPGALAFVDQYASYTNDNIYEPIHPFFDDILKETGGVALYQEQLMKMANKVGFTLDEAEILRRIVGKKKTSEVRKWKKKIKEKIEENKIQSEVGDILWGVLEDSASYSFNKSHSCCYAALAAITTYLKFKYPQQFFLSLLKMTRHEPEPITEISKIHKEMASFNIQLLPPHLVKSEMDFSLENENIRFGLLSIKGISDKSIEKLSHFKNQYSTKFQVFEAAKEAGLGIGVLCALIQAGAFEGFAQSRSKVVYEAQLWNLLTMREKRHANKYGEKYEFDLVKLVKDLLKLSDEKNKPVIKKSRFETLKKRSAPYLRIYTLNKKSENFANWFYEKNLLGYTYGKTLKDIFSTKRGGLMPVNEVEELPVRSRVLMVARIEDDPQQGKSREKGNKYMRMMVGDETSSIKTMIFNKKLEECIRINNGTPEKKQIVVIKGTKFEDVVFADLISVQDNKVYTKLSEIKNIEA